jgi:hypothetical protein
MNRMLYVFVVMLTCLCASELMYAQRVLVPLANILQRTDPKYNNFWVDTLGAGFKIEIKSPPIYEVEARLYTTRVPYLSVTEDIIELSTSPSVGDTLRKTMLRTQYQSLYDSLQMVVQQFGGGTITLRAFTYDGDIGKNLSNWSIYFTDTVAVRTLNRRIEKLNLYTIYDEPGITLIYPDPFTDLTSLISEFPTKLPAIECYPIPASTHVTIHIPLDKNLSATKIVELLSIDGELISKRNIQLSESDGKLSGTLPLNGISNGIYLVRVGDYTKLITILR